MFCETNLGGDAHLQWEQTDGVTAWEWGGAGRLQRKEGV